MKHHGFPNGSLAGLPFTNEATAIGRAEKWESFWREGSKTFLIFRHPFGYQFFSLNRIFSYPDFFL